MHRNHIISPAAPGANGTLRNHSLWSNKSVRSTLSQIDQLVPRFRLEKDTIKVLHNPSEFYSVLKQKITAAHRRVFLASLYIGADEDDLIQCLDQALFKNPDLEVHILTDALRGTRKSANKSTASLLAPLISKFGSRRVHLHMYHTPHLHGIRQQLIPQRFNEGWGLQHMKLYGFDDEVILSGANLSNDYFTNRQDRYILFNDAGLTNYFFKVFEIVSKLSYSLQPSPGKNGYSLIWSHNIPEPTNSPNEYIHETTKLLAPILKKPKQGQPETDADAENHFDSLADEEFTYVYPISQFSQLLIPDTSTEFSVLSRLLSMLGSDQFEWTLTAGYFNIHPEFRDKLLLTKPVNGAEVITASPLANGFYNSSGVSSLLPGAYSHLAEQFLRSVHKAGKEDSIRLFEWKRGVAHQDDGWTYHAKGIWVGLPADNVPCMTVIGSSNYTRRSYSHDLESNALLITSDKHLQQSLKYEISHLKEYTNQVTLEDYEKDETRQLDWRQKLFCRFWGDKL